MNRRQFILQTGLAGAWTFGTGALRGLAQDAAERERPNIILLLTDDQRWDTLGCMGHPIVQTPNIDRLAKAGVVFDNNFCTCSICMTSRASIFSGQYARRHKIRDFATPFSDEALAQTYPLLLRQAGYRTGFIGKWGVGNKLPADSFDYFKGFPGQGRYFHEIDGVKRHLTSIIGDQSLEFLRGCSGNQPFCLSVSFKAPHCQDGDPKQFLYDPVFEDLYQDVTIPVPKTADPRYFEMLPEFVRNSEARRRWGIRFSTPELFQQMVKGYLRLITGVDVVVGRIVECLKEQGFTDDTVILFSSDNGFFLGEHGLAGKWLMYEESIRTPLVIYDPRLPLEKRGRRREEMTLNIDLAPTILELAGIAIPTSVQGISLCPLVAGETPDWRDEWFYEYFFSPKSIPTSEGVRTKRWKYIRYIDAEPLVEELYDLENDPCEERNLVSEKDHKTTLDYLRRRWQKFREELV